MKSVAVWFELPVTDMERAKKFYQQIFEIEMDTTEMGGALMSFFPMEETSNSGALVKADDAVPSDKGTLVYLNGGDDLTYTLQRVEPAGGKLVVAKTQISPEYGYFGLFRDTEGNIVGLHSMK
ncbi:VOC family protein [candidate division KSB1 bacterium]|nr:VOC family protein [candidate division KSB1 bacterium]